MERKISLVEATQEQLRAERKIAGLSQEKLGDASGVARASIALFERKERVPNIQQLEAICGVLGLEVVELLRRAEGRRG